MAQVGPGGPQPLAWTAPANNQYPSIQQIVASQGAPTTTCFRICQNPNNQSDTRRGGWTNYFNTAQIPDNVWRTFSNVIFVIQRFSGTLNQRDEGEYWVAQALVGARVQEGLFRQQPNAPQNPGGGNNRLPGTTLIICISVSFTGDHDMPAFNSGRTSETGRNAHPMFIDTMVKLSELHFGQGNQQGGQQQGGQGTQPIPSIYIVGRSISSTSTATAGWSAFLQRFSVWKRNLYLILQLRRDWPAPDQNYPVNDARCPPYQFDPIYRIKFLFMPLQPFANYREPPGLTNIQPNPPALPNWYATVRRWMQEEYNVRTAAVGGPIVGRVLSNRGMGRLCF